MKIVRLAAWVLLVCLVSVGEVYADAWCTPTGGVAVRLDPAGENLAGMTCNGDLSLQNLSVSRMTGAGALTVTGNMVITAGAVLRVNDTPTFALINVAGDLDLQGTIDGSGGHTSLGFPREPVGGTGGAGSTIGTFSSGSGGGHGGRGGRGVNSVNKNPAGGLTYDQPLAPILPGSAGGDGNNGVGDLNAGGRGGAAIKFLVGGLFTLDGLINVDGAPGIFNDALGVRSSGGGSGGSVWVLADVLATHLGGVRMSARGGTGGASLAPLNRTAGGGGGGGLVAVYFNSGNGGVLGPPLALSHLSCSGGATIPTLNDAHPGVDGQCRLVQSDPAPVLSSATPSFLGVGVTGVPVAVSGANISASATFEVLEPGSFLPAAGITLDAVVITPPNAVALTLTVDAAANTLPAANPKILRVTNPDARISPDAALLTINPAPVLTRIEDAAGVLTSMVRGASADLVLFGSLLQNGATVSFSPPAISVVGPIRFNPALQTLSFTAQVNEAAAAGAVSVSIINPDGGISPVPVAINILSQPQITDVFPNLLLLGQGPVSVTVTGTGFISGSEVLTSGNGLSVVPGSTVFNSFTQLTALLSVDVEADLSVTTTRQLWVDNHDLGVSPTVPFELAAVAGVNRADLLYGSAAVATPQFRFWNGFGTSQVKPIPSPIPQSPEWVLNRTTATPGELLMVSVRGGNLYLQERSAAPALVWQAPLGPIAVTAAIGSRRVVDVSAISGVGGERYLVTYGTTGGGLGYRLIGGIGGVVPRSAAACAGVDEVVWTRLVANGTGSEAVLTYAKANSALCAVVWRNGGFDVTTEQVLAAPAGLVSLSMMVFDATYWGASGSQQAMVAWGPAGSRQPGIAQWDGTAWTPSQALTAVMSGSATIGWLRLEASPTGNRVVLVNGMSSGGLLAQFWNGFGWGQTFAELPQPLVSPPDVLSELNGSRSFDVAWSSTLNEALVVYGESALGSLLTPVIPKARQWREGVGWGAAQLLPGSTSRQEPRWVQMRRDVQGGDLLAGVVDGASSSTNGTLTLYPFDGIVWNTGKVVASDVPVGSEAFEIRYRFGSLNVQLSVSAVGYQGVVPASLGRGATSQALRISGSGFLNVPQLTFSSADLAVEEVRFLSPELLLATVSVGANTPLGSHTLSVVNPGGTATLFTQGLQVTSGPSAIHVVNVAATCTPTAAAPAASACAVQGETLALEVRGLGVEAGASVRFANPSVNFTAPPTYSLDAATQEGVFSGTVQVTATAPLGPGDVTVTNPDSSTSVGVGIFEVVALVDVTNVLPTSIGAGAQGLLLTVSGINFQPGVSFDFGPGITVNSVLLLSSTRVLVDIGVAEAAAVTGRQVTVSNADGGTATSAGVLFTVLPGATFANITPSTANAGITLPVVVRGTGLATVNTPAQVVFSDPAFSAANVVPAANGLSVGFDLTVGVSASFTASHDLTLHLGNGGAVFAPAVFSVTPVPNIVSVTPASFRAGEPRLPVSVTGTGFQPGAVLIADPGITIMSQSSGGAGSIDALLAIGPNIGVVNLFVANPNGSVSAPFGLSVVAADALTVSTGDVTISPTSARVYASINVTGGRLIIQGDQPIRVLTDVTVSGGEILFDPSARYARLIVDRDVIIGTAGKLSADATGQLGGQSVLDANGLPGRGTGTNGSGLGGGTFAGISGFFVVGGRGGSYGGTGGTGIGTGSAPLYDMLGVCTNPGCFLGLPLALGSGGGSGWARNLGSAHYYFYGGNGGGALVLQVARNLVVDGQLSANGGVGSATPENATGATINNNFGAYGAGGGSGGGLTVLVNGSVSGAASGRIEALGGSASPVTLTRGASLNGTGGGGGRVALYHKGANSFGGVISCAGGGSPHVDFSYSGGQGDCLVAPLSEITGTIPTVLAQGVTVSTVIQGPDHVAGDTVLFTDPGLTGGPLAASGLDLAVSISAAANVPLGRYDIIVRHATQRAAVLFDGFSVGPKHLFSTLTPDHLPEGSTAVPVAINGSLFDPASITLTLLRGGAVLPATLAIQVAASTAERLQVNVTLPTGVALGRYDLRIHSTGGSDIVVPNAFTVTALAADRPSLASVLPGVVGGGGNAIPVRLLGYDFGTAAGGFALPQIVSSNPNLVLSLDPTGCPGPGNEALLCEPSATALQHIDALVSTVNAVGGEVTDVSLTQGGATSTLTGGLSVALVASITTLSPNQGVDSFTLSVTGNNFSSNAVISVDDASVTVGPTSDLGGVLVANVTVPVDTPTQVTHVRVTNIDGGQAATPWTLNPQPLVTAVTPLNSLRPGNSTTVTVQGAFFHPNATVSFGAGINVLASSFISPNALQVTIDVTALASPGVRTVSVSNHVSRPAGTLAAGFTVSQRLLLQSITPASLGQGAGTRTVNVPSFVVLSRGQPEGKTLTLAGREIARSTTLYDLEFSNSGVHRLTNLSHSDIDTSGSLTETDVGITGYRAIQFSDGSSLTSGQFLVMVEHSAAPGLGTVIIHQADGSTSSLPFEVTPAPVVTFAEPNKVVRGQTVDLILSGFFLDTANPKICFGSGCDFGVDSTSVKVVSIRPQSPNRVDVTIHVDSGAALGDVSLDMANPDGGTEHQSAVIRVVESFSVNSGQQFALAQGATGALQSISGIGFSSLPSAAQVAFLRPDGTVDPDVSVRLDSVSSGSLNLNIDVALAAAPGVRGLRITNGDGAILVVDELLLVTAASGPTAGSLGVPDGVGGFGAPVLGLGGWFDRTVVGLRLTGNGLSAGGLALSFDRPGVAASGLTVVDDQHANFTLHLAQSTVPGVVGMTVTTAAGSARRADALVVNAAPLISSARPTILKPLGSNQSILLDGGNFQQDIQASVVGPDISLRDFDSSRAGAQPSWVSARQLRVVVDVAPSATGSHFLELKNTDGGVGRVQLTIGSVSGTPAKVVYMTNRDSFAGLEVRDWVGTEPLLAPVVSDPFTIGAALPHDSRRDELSTDLYANPMNPGEYILSVAEAGVVVPMRLKIYRLLPGATVWQEVLPASFLPQSLGQPFDLAYEQAGSGRAILVYGSGTTLWIKRITAAGVVVSKLVTIGGQSPFASGAVDWVRLVPQADSQRILVLVQTAGHKIQAMIWDGAAAFGDGAFISQYDAGAGTPLTSNGPIGTGFWDIAKRSIAGSWEVSSGRAVAFWGEEGSNSIHAVHWDPVTGWGTPRASTALVSGGSPIFVEAVAAPSGNRIAVLSSVEIGVNRSIVADFYVGGWQAGGQLFTNNSAYSSDGTISVSRNFDLAWSGDQLVTMYTANTVSAKNSGALVGALYSRSWKPATGWGEAVRFPNVRGLLFDMPGAVEIVKDPESDDLIAVVLDRVSLFNTPHSVDFYRWNGFGWTDYESMTAQATHFSQVSFGNGRISHGIGHSQSAVYRADRRAPDAVNLTVSQIGASSAAVAWTAPGDNGASGVVGGYDIRWSLLNIVDDASVADCAALPVGDICFSDANQVVNPPLPVAAGGSQLVSIDFGTPGIYHVALKSGDRVSTVDNLGRWVLQRNVSPISNVVTVITLLADMVPPEAVTDLAASAGANAETMVNLTWTGVGDDGDLSTTDPVQHYELRVASLPISEVGGDNNFHTPFDQAVLVARVSPAVDGTGGTRGVANSYLVTGLNPGTDYHFAVKGVDEDIAHYALVSNIASITTTSQIPVPINDLQVSGVGVNDMTLSWTARGGGPTSYDLRVSTDIILDDQILLDGNCDLAPVGQRCHSRAARVLNVPVPAADGVRQSVIVPGLAPDTVYNFSLLPVRFNQGPAISAKVSGTTQVVTSGSISQPSAVSDLAVVGGSIRADQVRLRWTAPVAAEGRVLRYEMLWSTRPIVNPGDPSVHIFWLPLLPATSGVAQEFTLLGLPENAVVYVALRSLSLSGITSALSSQVRVHTALRSGINAISLPGSLSPNGLNALLGSTLGSCPSTGLPVTGVGPVPGCANGESPLVTAFTWDPTVGPNGDYVAVDHTDLIPDVILPGQGLFVLAIGTHTVLNQEGFDLASFVPSAIPNVNAGVMSNPFRLPVAVADLVIVGRNAGGTELYRKTFNAAVLDGVINPELAFPTRVGSLWSNRPVTASDDLLPYRAYFIQLGGTPDAALNYFVEVPHP